MPEFTYTDLLPTGADGTTYRRLTSDGVRNHGSFGRNFLEVEPELLTLLTSTAMHDIAHLLRPVWRAEMPQTANERRKKGTRRRRGKAGRGRGHRGLSAHRADGGTARRGAAA